MKEVLARAVTHREFLKMCGLAIVGAGAGQMVVPPKSISAADQTIDGNLTVNGSSDGFIYLSGANPSIRLDRSSGTDWHIVNESAALRFYTGIYGSGTHRLTIDQNGNVGIAITSPGVGLISGRTYLTIQGSTGAGVFEAVTAQADADSNVIGLLQFTDKNSTSSDKRAAGIVGWLSGSTPNNRGGALTFVTKADNANVWVERMRIDNAGRVGIGTANPLSKLAVYQGDVFVGVPYGDANTSNRSVDICTMTPGIPSLTLQQGGTSGVKLLLTNMTFRIRDYSGGVDGSDLFTIKYGGNVGIGTANPDATLHLNNGNIKIGTRVIADSDGSYYA